MAIRVGRQMTGSSAVDTREAFSRQPVRGIVIDAGVPFGEENIDYLTDAIKHLLCVICSLRGPARIPGLSIVVSHGRPDVLLPMQKVAKPLYGRMLASMDRLPAMTKIIGTDEFHQSTASLEQALVFASNDFRKFKELSGFPDQLEISVFSYKSTRALRSIALATIRNLNANDIKRIEFVSLAQCSEGLLLTQSSMDQVFSSQEAHADAEQSEFSCLWNIVKVESNIISIQCHMRHWFKDECSDREHLCLTINDMLLKCDTQRRYVHPDELPFKHFYALGELPTIVNTSNRMPNKSETLPILHLRAKALIRQEGICESLLFGAPVVLISSSCWRMEWDELDRNQDRFAALCKTLQEQHQCLLCENTTRSRSSHKNNSNTQSLQPRGLFLLLPSTTSSMLLKAVVPRELFLPTSTDSLSEKSTCSPSAVSDVKCAVDGLEKADTYNPLNHSCELYESLNAFLLPKSAMKHGKKSTTVPAFP